ncbi:MAG TPA: hypothetical protein VL098_01795 [Flavipsychrobacter sp.]|nr:hypothetical protein [Flavipsychrobacter sp.]
MKILQLSSPLIFLFLLHSCVSPEKERKLNEKELFLSQKEQQLAAKEQELQLRENELVRRESLPDSNQNGSDTLSTYDAAIVGDWNVKMTCIETNCESSAIGDTKTEQWTLAYDNNQVTAHAYAKKILVRDYRGTYLNNVLHLAERENTTGTEIVVNVSMDEKNKNKMKGTRTISKPNCKIVYSLELEKDSKK